MDEAPASDPPPRRRWRVLRRLLWGALASLATVVAVAWMALLAVLYGWGLAYQRAPLEWALSSVLQSEVRIDSLQGSVLDGLVIRGVALGPAGEGGLAVERVELEVDLSRLLPDNEISIRRLAIEGLSLAVERDDTGRWRVEGLESLTEPKPAGRGSGDSGPSLELELVLDRLELSDARVEAAWNSGSTRHEAEGGVDLIAEGLHWPLGPEHPWPEQTRAVVTLARARLAGVPVEDGRVSLYSVGPELTFEPSWVAGDFGRIDVVGEGALEGSLRTARVAGLELEATFVDLAVEEIVRRESLRARVRGTLDLDIGFPDRTSPPAPVPGAAAPGAGPEPGSGPEPAAEGAPAPRDEQGITVAFHADLGASSVRDVALTAAEVAGRYEAGPGRWRIEQGRIEGGGGFLSATGAGDREGIEELRIEAEDVDLAMVPGLPEGVRGRGALEARGRGSWADLRGSGRVSLRGVAIGPVSEASADLVGEALGEGRYRVDELRLEGRLAPLFVPVRASGPPAALPLDLALDGPVGIERRDPGWQIDGLALRTSVGRLALDGRVAVDAETRVQVQGQSIDLPGVARLVGWPGSIDGTLAFDLALEGTTRSLAPGGRIAWSGPAFEGLEADTFTLALVPEGDGLRADARLRSEERETLRAELRLPRRLPLRSLGSLAERRDVRIELALDGFAPEWLTAWKGLDPLPLGGRLFGRLALEGPRAEPRLDGHLEWRDARYGELTADSLAADLATPVDEAGRGWAELELTLIQAGERTLLAKARGSAALLLTEPAALPRRSGSGVEVFADALPVAWLAGIPGSGRLPFLAELSGRLDGHLALDGPLESPRLDGRLQWKEARYGQAFADRVEMELDTVAGEEGPSRLEVALTVVADGDRALFANARLPVAPLLEAPGELLTHRATEAELLADSLQLTWLEGMAFGRRSPLSKLAGRVDGQVKLWGGEPEPLIEGEIELSAGRVSLPGLDSVFQPIEGVVRIEESRLRVEQLDVGSGRGTARITGGARWGGDDGAEVDLRAVFRRFAVDRSPLVEAELEGELTLEGSARSPDLEGRLALRNARLALPEPKDPLLREVRVLSLPDSEGATSIREGERVDPLDPARMDVVLEVPRGTWVRGRGLDAQIRGELRASKKPGLPITYSGALETTAGSYTYAGRTFEVRRGNLSLPGGGEIDPVLDIEAVYELPDVTLFVLVSGPLSEISEGGITLESDPPLDNTDKLSYLAFGRPTDQLGQGERTKLSDTATQVLGHLLLDLMGSRVAETFAIDRVEVSRSPDGETTEVELEKRVGDQIIVRYGRSLREGAGDRVEIEYRLNRQWSLQSDVSNSGDSGVDLLWTYDY